MIELMKEWAELEPDRCQVVRQISRGLVIDVYNARMLVENSDPGSYVEAIVQGAVQEAIASHKDIHIEMHWVKDTWSIDLSPHPYDRAFKGGWDEGGKSAAIALLTAYLKYLRDR